MKTQAIAPLLRWIADDIRIAAEPSMSPQKALKVLLTQPGWEEKVKDYFKNQKQAGKVLPTLALAILTLTQATGAQTANELIQKVKQKSEQTQVKEEKVTQRDVQKMKDILPFPVTEFELKTLSTGAVPFFMFKGKLEKKIRESLDKKVMPAVDKDPRFSSLPAKELTKLILDAFMAKINDPQYKDAHKILSDYLKGDMNKVRDIARNTVSEEVTTALR